MGIRGYDLHKGYQLYGQMAVSAIPSIVDEDIMNHHVLQGTQLEAAVLAHMPMDLYTPAHRGNEQEAKTFRTSP
jgi:hypothetical protein